MENPILIIAHQELTPTIVYKLKKLNNVFSKSIYPILTNKQRPEYILRKLKEKNKQWFQQQYPGTNLHLTDSIIQFPYEHNHDKALKKGLMLLLYLLKKHSACNKNVIITNNGYSFNDSRLRHLLNHPIQQQQQQQQQQQHEQIHALHYNLINEVLHTLYKPQDQMILNNGYLGNNVMIKRPTKPSSKQDAITTWKRAITAMRHSLERINECYTRTERICDTTINVKDIEHHTSCAVWNLVASDVNFEIDVFNDLQNLD